MVFLNFLPEITYPAAMKAPINASKFPKKNLLFAMDTSEIKQEKFPEIKLQLLPNITNILPKKAIPRKKAEFRVILSDKRNGESKATQSGVVVTNTTELATEVISSEEIQAAKWNARNKPDNTNKNHTRCEKCFISLKWLERINTAVMRVASDNR